MNLEGLRRHPARYLIPNAMTISRPILGWKAMKASQRGDWDSVGKYLYPAFASDLEGNPARFLDATSRGGSYADPIADIILKAEVIKGLATELSGITTGIVIAGELTNVFLNLVVQNGSDRPNIPKLAKLGAVVQATGGVMFTEGLRRKNKIMKKSAEATIIAGTALRVGTYYSLYRKDRKGLPWYTKHPRHTRSQS